MRLVHHTGKAAEKGARGSSALLGAMDTMLEISRQGDSPQRTITLKKSRDSEDGVKVAFSLQPVVTEVNEDGKEISVPVVVPAAVPLWMRATVPRRLLGWGFGSSVSCGSWTTGHQCLLPWMNWWTWCGMTCHRDRLEPEPETPSGQQQRRC